LGLRNASKNVKPGGVQVKCPRGRPIRTCTEEKQPCQRKKEQEPTRRPTKIVFISNNAKKR